ncbi:hypothetical protein [Streptomyces chrestomyceticus]|uniref:hypothetical protein n=1 Tax=Streptomyces chrestomyceticus TaxID=68185 RepID=UPI0037A6CA4D
MKARLRRVGLPYLLLLPALALELLIHLVPMAVGVAMSFKELTQFFIRDWNAAPWSGLANFRIAVPSLRPVNQVLVLVLFLWTFNDFNTPYVLFGRSVPEAADLISVHIYQASFVTWNFGAGSAMSVLLLLFLLVVAAAYLLVTSRRDRGDRGPRRARGSRGRRPARV